MTNPSPFQRLRGIDVLRAVAAMGVVFHHAWRCEAHLFDAWAPLARLLVFAMRVSLGQWGVGVFFLLSGLCIHLPMARAQSAGRPFEMSLGAYYRRRFRRIYPPHFVALVLSAVVALSVTARTLRYAGLLSVPTLGQFALHLGMAHTFVPSAFYSINSVLWTIALEAHFYLLYPLVVRLRARVRIEVIAAVLLGVSIAIRVIDERVGHGPFTMLLLWNVPGRWWEWMMGAVAAEWLTKRATRPAPPVAWSMGGGLAAVGGSFAFTALADRLPEGAFIAGVACPFVFFAVLLVAAPMRVSSSSLGRGLVTLGSQSYSLYLSHPIAMTLLVALVPALHGTWSELVALVVGSCAFSTLFFWLVERRFLPVPAPVGPAAPSGGA